MVSPDARELSRRLGEITGPDEWTPEQAREWWQRHQPAGDAVARAGVEPARSW
jgi:hypothetical protein